MLLKKFLEYLYPPNWFKKSTEDPSLRFMHGTNKISIVMFLFCIIVLIYKVWLK